MFRSSEEKLRAFYGERAWKKTHEPLPSDYSFYRNSYPFALRDAESGYSSVVGKKENCGMRWHYGPLWFEKYVTDIEPLIEKCGQGRIVIWQPLTRQDRPSGWLPFLKSMSTRCTGFVNLSSNQNYTKAWSEHARRHLARWKKEQSDDGWEISEISFEEYKEVNKRATIEMFLRALFPHIVSGMKKKHGERLVILGAKKNGVLESALAVLDVPEAKLSVHVSACMTKEGKKSNAQTGLLDEWFRRSLAKDMRFLEFGLFWAPGDPNDWKGYSRFKSKFGVRLVVYPQPLFRFAQ